MLLKRTFQNHPGLEDDLYKLKNNPYLSLQNISDKHKLSRERIRRIYNQFFNTSYGKHKNSIEDDLSCSFDPRNKSYLIDENSNVASRKYNVILKFIEICRNKNFKIESTKNKSVTIVVNGFNVKIKQPTSSGNAKFSPRQKCKYYVWKVSKAEKRNNNFIALYRNDIDKFIIMKTNFKIGYEYKSIYMLSEKSDYRTAKNRYWDLINRFDFLRNEKSK